MNIPLSSTAIRNALVGNYEQFLPGRRRDCFEMIHIKKHSLHTCYTGMQNAWNVGAVENIEILSFFFWNYWNLCYIFAKLWSIGLARLETSTGVKFQLEGVMKPHLNMIFKGKWSRFKNNLLILRKISKVWLRQVHRWQG